MQALPELAAWLGVTHHQFRMQEEYGKKVVKIVCNPPRQRTHGFDLLSLAQLTFQLFALGNIHGGDEQGGLMVPGDRRDELFHPNRFTVSPNPLNLVS